MYMYTFAIKIRRPVYTYMYMYNGISEQGQRICNISPLNVHLATRSAFPPRFSTHFRLSVSDILAFSDLKP